jgi:Tfp pilus assembly protein PilF
MEESQRVLDAALKSNPKDTSALFQRGEVYIRQNRLTEAEADLTQVLHGQPDRAEAHYLMSEIHKARGADLLQRDALTTALRQKPELLVARISLAYSLISAKQPKSALDVLDHASETQKQSTQYIAARNGVLMAMRSNNEARKGVDLGLAHATDPGLMLQDAVLRLQQKDYDGARLSLEAILKQDPENVGALDVLTRSFIAQKQPATAAQRVREQAAMRPGSFSLQVFAGNWFLANRNPSGARAAFNAAKAADSHNPVPEISLAQLDWAEGNLNDARGRLSAVLASNDQNIGAHLVLAMLEDRAGNSDEARTHYLKTVELDPKQVVALNGLAYVLVNHTNQLDEAFKYGQQAKELDPANPAVDDTLGWILFRQGHYKPALESFQSAAAKDQDPVIKYHLAMTYFKLGEMKQGLDVLALALKVNPNLPEAALAQKVLAESTQRFRQ